MPVSLLEHTLDRRRFLSVAGVVSLAAVIGLRPDRARAEDPTIPSVWASSASLNGWPLIPQPPGEIIEGTNAVGLFASGAPSVILSHVCRRYSYEIGQLETSDVGGWGLGPEVLSAYESNFLSGTAVKIRKGAFPVGSSGGYLDFEMTVIRDILADCEGLVRWGGDFDVPDEGHFQLDVGPAEGAIERLARRILGWIETPGEGAGAVDAFDPGRIADAAAVEQSQND